MDFKLQEYAIPQSIDFNYEELKTAIQTRISDYTSMVYTEEDLPKAKDDRARLNKLKKTLDDERKELKKIYLAPFNEFEKKVKDILAIIDDGVIAIDEQVKGYEEIQITKKLDDINSLLATILKESTEEPYTWLTVAHVWSDKWLNKTVSLKTIEGEIRERIKGIESDLTMLRAIPELGEMAVRYYRSSLSTKDALYCAKEYMKMKKLEAADKAEYSEKQQPLPFEPTPDEKEVTPIVTDSDVIRTKLHLTVTVSMDEVQRLKRFLEINSIEYELLNA